MIQEITLKQASPMGEPDRTYGQTYWCYVQEFDEPVKITTKKTMSAGTTFYGALTEKDGKKGKFYNFKSVSRDEYPPSTPVTHSKPAGDVLEHKRYEGTCSWGEALIAAHIRYSNDARPTDRWDDIMAYATKLLKSKPEEDDYASEAPEIDWSEHGNTTQQIDLDSIPF